jgi:hypothetical protein
MPPQIRRTIIWLVLPATLALAAIAWTATRPDDDIPFAKHTIDLGQNEPAAFADINRDGKPDLISGENWYEAPRWTRHHFRSMLFTTNYIDDFSDLPMDVNGDGYPDIVSCGWFSKSLWWDENPGRTGGQWKRHGFQNGYNVEFCFAVDLDNDGRKTEILPEFGNADAPLSWYELKNNGFVRHIVSPRSYGHGIGAGDVNHDGRTDILTPKGWFEAPADPRSGDWKYHADWDLGGTGFIYVHDVNGDGRPDLLTSAAHDYGVFWMENLGNGHWKKHVIDDSWSQAHAMTLADLNGDGRPDLITGKRFMAHNGRDPGEREPLGVYWYEYLPPDKGGNVEWVKHVVDYGGRTGGGMQIAALDFDRDGDLDFAVGGKSGLFLFENLTRRSGR